MTLAVDTQNATAIPPTAPLVGGTGGRPPGPVSVAAPQDLLTFAQALETAQRSGIPLPTALAALARQLPSDLAADWAARLAQSLREGRSLAEAVDGLSGLDPVLAALLKNTRGAGPAHLLGAYVRHVVQFARISHAMRSVYLYPFLLLLLVGLNLLLLNTTFFPAVKAETQGFSNAPHGFMTLLFLFDIDCWPWSIPIPLAIMALWFLFGQALFFTPFQKLPETILGRLIGLTSFLKAEEQARATHLLALFLESGLSLDQSLHQTSIHLESATLSTDLRLLGEAVAEGISPEEAVRGRPALTWLAAGTFAATDTADLIRRLKNISASRLRDTESRISLIHPLGQAVGVVLVGFFVLLLGGGIFGTYSGMVGGRP
jgi:type II secretory pathway component PulF